nr:MAG TPA: SMODS-associating 2TM, beta-strand rich effector domain [Caudoviricetes sp.]
MVNRALKSFGILCVIAYIVVAYISQEPLQSISSAVSISVVLFSIYSTFLWRYNPLEKTPYIGGTYSAHHFSSYKDKPEYTTTIIIKQNLFSLSFYETGSSGWCGSIAVALTPTSSDAWEVVCTYRTHPLQNVYRSQYDQDDPHEGTMLLCYHPSEPSILSGTYFTNRPHPTRGETVLTRKKNNRK